MPSLSVLEQPRGPSRQGAVSQKSNPSQQGGSNAVLPSVRVRFCEFSNYGALAGALATSLREQFGVCAELTPSRGGVFEVEVADRLIFSKRATFRLPAEDEVFYHVKSAIR